MAMSRFTDQITEDVQAIAGYLASKGIKNGDPVGILSENQVIGQ